MTAFCGDVPIQIMPIKIIVLTEYNPSGSRPNFFGRQHLTFDKGRAWMPEVERPEFRKDAKPTERSYGKSDSAFRGIVRKRRTRWDAVGAVKTLLLYYRTPF